MVRDIEHLNTRLGKVEGFGDLSDYLLKIVNGKDVKAPDPPAAPAPEDDPKGNEREGEVEKEGEKADEKADEGDTSPESKSERDPVEKEGVEGITKKNTEGREETKEVEA